ncbi:MAG: hypothetical protein NVS4B13_10090 [Candidatus Elarobacter sp.]
MRAAGKTTRCAGVREVHAARYFAVAVAIVVTGLAAPGIASNGDAEFTDRLPSVFRDASVHPSLFKTVTRYAVSDAEYHVLGTVYCGPMFVRNGYKIFSVWDQHKHVVLAARYCCALQEWMLFPAPRALSRAVPANLAGVTVGGIGLGAPAGSVVRRFGRSDTKPRARGEYLVRYRHQQNHDCATFYTFEIDRERVRAISVKNAC